MIQKDPSDKYLIERYVSGDTPSLAMLVKKWHRIFCDRAFFILKDKELSKDVAQECWIIIIKSLHTLENRDSFKSWAFRILYNKSIDALKHRKKESQVRSIVDEEKTFGLDVKEEVESKEKKLLQAINNLPKEKQDIIRLFYLENYSLKKISSFLQIPVGTVKSRLFTAREKLKTIINSNDYEK